MTCLGIVFSHDGTLSIVRNGRNDYSCAEERINHIKSYVGFPFMALRESISSGRLDPQEVKIVAIPLRSYPWRAAQMFAFLTTEDKIYYDLQNEKAPEKFSLKDDGWKSIKSDKDCREYVIKKIKIILEMYGINAPIEFYDHHLSHAASAYYSSGLQNALAITMDGEGDGLSATVNICKREKIKRISFTSREDSAGYLYAAVTKRCGFKMSRHEGKITGLAAHGNSDTGYQRIAQHVIVVNGRLKLKNLRRNNILEKLIRRAYGLIGLHRTFGAFQLVEKCNDISNEDLAASMQRVLEDRLVEIVRYWVEKTGIRDVVVAGGIFANVKFNQCIGALDVINHFFVFPDMGDGGTAYGAAMLADVKRNGYIPDRSKLSSVYLGPEFTDQEIVIELEKNHNIKFHRSKDIAYDTAKLIAAGSIVGWFQGRMEYGPRALGSRSILASAADGSINKWLNERMRRTEFMPFAPSCLYEHAEDVFEIEKFQLKRAAEFMTLTMKVRDEWAERVPAITHVDQTARPQLIKYETNPLYHKMVMEYYKISGIPLIINTSFNVHEQPIVCGPNEAIECLATGVIDYLVIGGYIASYSKVS